MIKFDIFEISELITNYQDRYNLDDKAMREKADMTYSTFYNIKYRGGLLSRKKLQKSFDNLGLRLVVDGKEFRMEDFRSVLREFAERKKVSLNNLSLDLGYGCSYSDGTISVPKLQDMLHGLGYEIYIEEQK